MTHKLTELKVGTNTTRSTSASEITPHQASPDYTILLFVISINTMTSAMGLQLVMPHHPTPFSVPGPVRSTPSFFDRLWTQFVDQIREEWDRLWTRFVDPIREERDRLWTRFVDPIREERDRLWTRFVDPIREEGDQLSTQFIDQILSKRPSPHVMC